MGGIICNKCGKPRPGIRWVRERGEEVAVCPKCSGIRERAKMFYIGDMEVPRTTVYHQAGCRQSAKIAARARRGKNAAV